MVVECVTVCQLYFSLACSTKFRALLEMSYPQCYINGWDRVNFLSKL